MRACLTLAFVLSPLALTGCGDTFVDPFLRDASALSVYGVLEGVAANAPPVEQTIRVQSVRTNAEPPTDPDDPALAYRATVTSVDLATGDSTFWRPRRTQFSDGTYGDLFSATFRPRPGGSYRIVVRRDDGREATADVTIPLSPEGVVLDWVRRGQRQQVTERIAWETLVLDDASTLVEMECGINCGADIVLADTLTPFLGDERAAIEYAPLGDGRIAVEYNLSEAKRLGCIATAPPPPDPCPPLTLTKVTVDARILGPEWTRADDPTQTTVENGYGFVGGASRVRIEYLPTEEAAVAAGFAGI